MSVRLTSRMARLGEPGAPFRFQKGDRVAWLRFDGTPDLEFAGVIVDAVCEYQPGIGAYKAGYLVLRGDGSYFGVDHVHLMRLSTSAPASPPDLLPPSGAQGTGMSRLSSRPGD